jgi:hypothetical protein
VERIGDWAFMNCPKLASVSVPAKAAINPNAVDPHTAIIRR